MLVASILASAVPLSASAEPPVVAITAPHVDEATCVACHPAQVRAWAGSHHASAMTPAGPDHRVGVLRVDGKEERHDLVYAFGVAPLRQYLTPARGGRLQTWPHAWDTARAAWFVPSEAALHGDDPALRWSGVYQTWNAMCADCHSTGVAKNYDPVRDTYATTMQALSVGCQACHGPAEGHLAAVTAGGGARRDPYATPSAKPVVEVCAPCHSVRARIAPSAATAENPAGAPFLDEFSPALLTAGLYHADGQQDGEAYVYGSFLQSKMYARGVVCTDCHDAHGSKLRSTGNAVCTQCHSAADDRRRPDLPARDYAAATHSHHPEGSPGASCPACHMPAKVYMGLQARPDHAIRSPRPDLDAATGAPDACTGCHADRTPGWAAARIEDWFGKRERPIHYGEIFAAARRGDAGAGPALAGLAADGAQPAIVRATALDALGRHPGSATAAVTAGAADPDPLVRLGAVLGARGLAAPVRTAILAPLLRDPSRAVRTAAARGLADVPLAALAPDVRRDQEAALSEHVAAQMLSADLPAARLDLAGLHRAQGRTAAAEAEYRAALALDPRSRPGRDGLARALAALGREQDAVDQFEILLRDHPDDPRGLYGASALYGRLGRWAEAEARLGRLSVVQPADDPDVAALRAWLARQRAEGR